MRRRRIGADVVGFDEHAHAALNHCAEIHKRSFQILWNGVGKRRITIDPHDSQIILGC